MFKIDSLRFWCNKILPLVYDDSLSYYETLCKISEKLNEVINDMNEIPQYIANLISDEKLKEIMSTLLNNLQEQIASANEGESKTATTPRRIGELVWLSGDLYRITHDMIAGDQYVVNSNCEKVTIEELINGVTSALNEEITNRENADSALDEKINLETENRENADSALDEKINLETENRENADSEILNSILKLTPNYIFEDINSMVNFNGNFKVNDVIICCKNFGVWVVTDTMKSEYITKELKNGKYAEVITINGYFDINSLEIENGYDLYPLMNFLLLNGYNRVKIPKGNYSFSDTLVYYFDTELTPKLEIIGAGKRQTSIKCTKGFLKVPIKGYAFRDSIFSDFTISGKPTGAVGGTYNGFEFYTKDNTAEDMFDDIKMNNLEIAYFENGISIACRCIWNLFTNLTVHYCNRGLTVNETNTSFGFFNQNTFINCQFDVNQFEGVFILGRAGYCVSNLFDGCSIEGNFSSLGSATTGNFSEITLVGVSASFNGCHFEFSASTNYPMKPLSINGKSGVIMTGCCFISYPTYLYTVDASSVLVFNLPTFYNSGTANYGGVEAVINSPLTAN